MAARDRAPPAGPVDRGFTVRALGEIAIRCRDRAGMEAFYADVIGLDVLARHERGITFFRVGTGYGGHTAVLALFEDGAPGAAAGPRGHGAQGSLHHLALTVGWEEQQRAIAWYERIGRPFRVEDFTWIGWRGVFTEDPEGNTVELVAAVPGGVA
jgi:catechol 2,3-dioxygenase-like lactoylglutathione lyase family enzyme